MEKMNLETEDILYGGAAHRPAETLSLMAGSISCHYESGYLRYIKAGSTELVRMIYPAVRDHNWGTVSPRISNEKVVQGEDHFEIHYEAHYQEGEIDFKASFRLQGDRDGSILFEMQGEALNTFRKNRVGFNILHPPKAAEAPCIVKHTQGGDEQGVFPKYISPHQPFMDIKSIRWKMDKIWAQIDFEGDIFEMEDQRNWTDASFKTYSTPLSIPFPVTVKKGDKIHQAVRLAIENDKIHKHKNKESLVVTLGKERFDLPDIGIGQSSEISTLAEEDLKYLNDIHFSHYRVDIKLSEKDAAQQWERAVRESLQLELPLELALHFHDDHVGEELEVFRKFWERDKPSLKLLLIFSTLQKSSSGRILKKVLPSLRKLLPHTSIGAGTDCFFTELNRERVPTEGLDFLTYSLNPQVHQFDNQSLIETLQAQGFTVASARQFASGLPIHISPVTFKMRFNPNATGPEPEVQAGQLPPQIDTRQMSLFGAGWTMGSLKYLIESGLKSVTYFEALGRRGIMQGSHEPQLPEKFKGEQGILFPIYWIFYWLLQHKSTEVIHTESNRPLLLDSLAWEAEGERRMMLTNFQSENQEVEIRGWKEQYEYKMLDAKHFERATQKADEFLALPWEIIGNKITLSPYAICLLR